MDLAMTAPGEGEAKKKEEEREKVSLEREGNYLIVTNSSAAVG